VKLDPPPWMGDPADSVAAALDSILAGLQEWAVDLPWLPKGWHYEFQLTPDVPTDTVRFEAERVAHQYEVPMRMQAIPTRNVEAVG
jgi:hypothetical protein